MLGPLWAVVQPVILTIVLTFVFGHVARIDAGIPYGAFVYSGMLVWTLFSTGLAGANAALAASMGIASKANYPRIVAPISGALLAVVDFAIGIALLPVVLLVQGADGRLRLTGLLAFGGCLLLTLGVGVFLAAISVFVRDVRSVVPLALMMMLLVTPVAYPASRLPPALRWNPIGTFVVGFRSSVTPLPGPAPAQWLVAIAAALVVFAGSILYFSAVESRFADVA